MVARAACQASLPYLGGGMAVGDVDIADRADFDACAARVAFGFLYPESSVGFRREREKLHVGIGDASEKGGAEQRMASFGYVGADSVQIVVDMLGRKVGNLLSHIKHGEVVVYHPDSVNIIESCPYFPGAAHGFE